jgi:streptogramin lyase
MAADKKGRTVWVPNWAAGNIAEIDIDTLKPTFHKLPMAGQPYKVDVDNHHNVWATVPMADSLVKYDPAAKRWTVYRYATHGCGPRHIGVDKMRDEVWVPCDQASKVSRFQFRTAQQVQAQMTAAKGGK